MKKILVVLSLCITGIISGQIVTIPDVNFKAALLPIADTNNDGEIQISEAEAVQIMNVAVKEIVSMEGIQSFINLTTLNCFSNDLTELNLTQNVNLIELNCAWNYLTELDLSQNVNLIDLWCGANNFTDLDVSQNINLVDFNCGYTFISNFDLTHNLNLERLKIGNNTLLTSLDVSLNQALEELSCGGGELRSLITQNPNLTYIVCESNRLETIDISQNPNLEILSIGYNNLTELDVTQNQNLESINVSFNFLNAIDISQNPNLTYLNCGNNLLTELDFTNNPEIVIVQANDNLITELDFSESLMLGSLNCKDNQLVNLNVQNGNNSTLYYCNSYYNPNLDCIQVDDPIAANNNLDWIKDSSTVYSLECALGLDDSEIVQALIYPNPVRDILTIETKDSIKSIEVYSMLGELLASEKGNSQIDFSTYTKGIYFLKIDTKKGSVFQKVLKE